jgi:hypothetical protein
MCERESRLECRMKGEVQLQVRSLRLIQAFLWPLLYYSSEPTKIPIGKTHFSPITLRSTCIR